MGLLGEWYGIAGFLVGMVVVFMLLGIPVAFAFLTANIIGAMIYMGGLNAMPQIVVNAVESVTIFALIPVPLFIIMGELFFHTGLAIRVFDALDLCFGRLPGRLSYITVVGGTIFATLSGSTMANTAMMGSMMVPEMTSRGYKKHMSMGPILGTGRARDDHPAVCARGPAREPRRDRHRRAADRRRPARAGAGGALFDPDLRPGQDRQGRGSRLRR